MKAGPINEAEPAMVTAATKAARGGKKKASRSRKPPIETKQQQQQHKQTGMQEPPRNAKECAFAEPGGVPPQKDDSDWELRR